MLLPSAMVQLGGTMPRWHKFGVMKPHFQGCTTVCSTVNWLYKPGLLATQQTCDMLPHLLHPVQAQLLVCAPEIVGHVGPVRRVVEGPASAGP
jgi:hypothetical protein